MESNIPNLFRVIQDTPQIRAFNKTIAEQMTDKVRLFLTLAAHKFSNPLFQFFVNHRKGIALCNLKAKGKQVANQKIGQIGCLFAASSFEVAKLLCLQF